MKNKLSMDFPCYRLYNVSVADYIEPYKEYRTLRKSGYSKGAYHATCMYRKWETSNLLEGYR